MGCAPGWWEDEVLELEGRLKSKLLTSPVIAYSYPNFGKYFILETDASKKGLGAMLSQF